MRRALSALGLLIVVVGIPAGLLSTIGGPYLPNPSLSEFLETLRGPDLPFNPIVRRIGLAAWMLWAYLVCVLVLRGVAVVVARNNPQLGDRLMDASDRVTPPFIRKLVDVAVGGTLLLSSLGMVGLASTAGASAPVQRTARVEHAVTPRVEPPETRSYVVKPGDSLWKIAERELGSGYRWREIFEMNKERTFPDGRTLRNPRLIHPHWQLNLPALVGDGNEHRETAAETATIKSPQTELEVHPQTSPRPTPSRFEEHSKTPIDLQLPRPVVELPSGSVIAASFASGLLAAQALSALRRRRSRRALRQPTALDESPVVLDLRRAIAHPTAGQLEAAANEVVSAWRCKFNRVPRILAAVETSDGATFYLADHENGNPAHNASTSRVQFTQEGGIVRADVARPFPPKLARGESPLLTGLLVPLGHAKGRAAYAGLLAAGGLSIVGEGAEAFGLQAILCCAADTACEDLEIYVLGDLERLDPLPRLNHVRGSAAWEEAPSFLRDVQGDLVGRARAFLLEGVEDVWSHLAHDPEEYLHGLLIVTTEPPQALKGTIDAIASQASTLGGGLVAVGWKTHSIQSVVEVQGNSVSVPNAPPRLMSKMRAFRLEPEDAVQAVEVINAARPRAWEPEEEIEESIKDPVPLVIDEAVAESVEPNGSAKDEVLVIPVEDRTPIAPLLDFTVSAEPEGLPLETRAFGNLVMFTAGREVVKGLRTISRELLAYLVANPQGVNKERVLEDLWPDKKLSGAMKDLDWALYHLRQRSLIGRDSIELIYENYRLNPKYWWTDVSAFLSLIDRADRAGDARESMNLLSEAVGLYRGPFCDDCYFDWLEPFRDRHRVMAVRASAKLANLMMEFGDADQALSVLDEAIKIDPVNEDLYRRAIAIEGRLGRRESVIQRFNVLEAVLQDELDVDPSEQTAALLRSVLAEIEKERRSVKSD